MGVHFVTVEVVPMGMFEQRFHGHGYFGHRGGVALVLRLVGVDMKTPKLRRCGIDDVPDVTLPLIYTLCSNEEFQVTPAECKEIAEKLTKENFTKHVVGHNSHFFFPEYTEENDLAFFMDFAKFCRKARNFGGFYVR